MKCLNCGTECEGEYCHKCGQKTSTRRFQVKEIIESIIILVVGGDNKLWHTCYQLLYRPGHMVREYLLGKRATYYTPVRLLLFLIALFAIVTYFFADTMSPFNVYRPNIQVDEINSKSAEVTLTYFQMLMNNNVYFVLISVIMNLLPYRFIFRKYKLQRPTGTAEALNVAEHFFALVYQSCFNMLLAFILLPLSAFDDGKFWAARIFIIMPTIYCIILYKQMLGITWGKSIWLNIKAMIFGICLNIALLMLIIGILYGCDSIR